ncbi:Tetrahydrocannabinolic acid synthase [Podospora australis]|uniref:Tetrahydrocannabinolic acid synthase n=1 Tax=Podospora australis TaxID=1536484 RepID=A0AAN6WVM1_9PEZI|nr:Tetrahydrocannabinolic acid synthase [Podospora australis]
MASLLHLLWLFPFTATCTSIPRNDPVAAVPLCKSVPGADGWPSLDTWAAFNQSIDGRLLQPTPPGAVCHPDQPSYDASQCSSVQTAWFTEALHSGDPVSVMWNNWNNDTCLPDPRLSCSPTGYAVYVVNATTPQHVKAGVDFARKHHIRLIVKNSGHDYIGRSSGPNSLSIWVHHMKEMKVHETEFRPSECDITIPGHAITAGAGTQMQEAYRATALLNRTVVGGNGRTVALGGYITGGGHSILAPHYGMAADQVLEVELVTPTGEILTANECQNSDFFWAMRGGGGSTFGVLTSITLQTIPSPRVSSVNFRFSTLSSNAFSFDAVAYFLSQLPILEQAGVSGYPIVFKSAATVTNGVQAFYTGIAGILIMLNTPTKQTILDHINPIFTHINQTWPGAFEFYTDIEEFASFGAWYEKHYDPSPVGYSMVLGSRLLDTQALSSNITATKLAFEKFAAGGQANPYIVSGKGVWTAKPRGGSTAVSPAWRRTVVHATASVSFPAQDLSARTAATEKTRGFAAALRELSPNMGAYVNEVGADRYEPDWQQTFWGENYARLLQIKRTVDPDDVLWCAPCVGNERWHEVGDQLCRV